MNKFYPDFKKGFIVECYNQIYQDFVKDNNCDIIVTSNTWLNPITMPKINLPVYVYTVNCKSEKKRLEKLGVSGIISDRVELFCNLSNFAILVNTSGSPRYLRFSKYIRVTI